MTFTHSYILTAKKALYIHYFDCMSKHHHRSFRCSDMNIQREKFNILRNYPLSSLKFSFGEMNVKINHVHCFDSGFPYFDSGFPYFFLERI